MAFNNFHGLINRHKRQFQLAKKEEGETNPETGRFESGNYSNPIVLEGVVMTVIDDDIQKYPEFELVKGDLKLTISGTLLNGTIPEIKDRIVFDNRYFWINKIDNNIHYGNYYIIFLKEEKFGV